MVAPKIDTHAVQAELQSISALMSEIAHVMGPQVWQGGSAGAFTEDLQSNIRSLRQMMTEILRSVARANAVPMVLAPPDISQPTPASGQRGIASVSPSGLERLETALHRAADGLPNSAKRLRNLLSPAGPNAVGTAQFDRTSAWCRDQASRMRTRIMYALAENQLNPTFLVGGMSQIPDLERFGRKEMAKLGELQGQALSKHLKDPNAHTPELLTEVSRTLRENSKDVGYLTAFFNGVPPGSIGKLAFWLHQQHGGNGLTTDDKKLVGDIGTALAALSRKKNGQAAVTHALGPTGSDLPGQALLVKLSAPNVKWSSAILLDMAKAALRWRQKYPSYEIRESSGTFSGETHTSVLNQPDGVWWKDWGLGKSFGRDPDLKSLREFDPALNVLGRIVKQNDTAAARGLAATELENAFKIKNSEKTKEITWLTRGNGETYASLLVAPDWPDSGTTAGAVIKLATTPEKGHEEEAATNAAEIMKTVAWWNDKGREMINKFLAKDNPPDFIPKWDVLSRQDEGPGWMPHSKHYAAELGSGLRTGLLDMTRMHIAMIGDADKTASGTELPKTDPVTGRKYVDIGGKDVQSFLRTLAADDRTWAQLVADARIYRQRFFAWGLQTHKLNSPVDQSGFMEGNLIAAYAKERNNTEELTKKEYEDAQKNLGILRDVVGGIIGATPVGEAPGLTDTYSVGTDLALDKIKYKDFDKKIEAIKEKNSLYSDQLYVDLARGYALAHHGHTGDPEIDLLLRKVTLTVEEQAQVMHWTKEFPFRPRTQQEDEKNGMRLIREIENGVNQNNNTS